MTLPRYVTPVDEVEVPADDVDPGRLERLVHGFRVADGGNRLDVAIVVDLVGRLHVVVDPLATLKGSARQAWQALELARPLGVVALRTFWLFDAELVEQLDDTPGHDDPVVLSGELVGPYGPDALGATRRRAQMMVTRSELLRGLVRGADQARVVGADGRQIPAWLPADRDDLLGAGHGAVLCWVLPPRELRRDGLSNETLVDTVIHDLLGAMKADLQKQKADDPLSGLALPVPSRAEVARRLMSEGWQIQGNVAVRERPGNAVSGFFEMVFGAPSGTRMTLPPEARPGQLVDLARQQVARWPSNTRETALEARLDGVPSAPPAPSPVPRASSPDYRPPSAIAGDAVPAPKAAPQVVGDRDWEADFWHRPSAPRRTTAISPSSGAPTPTEAPPRGKKPPSGPSKGKKSWDDDFR